MYILVDRLGLIVGIVLRAARSARMRNVDANGYKKFSPVARLGGLAPARPIILVQCHAFWASGSDPTGCGQKAACLAVCFMTVDRTRHSINCLQHSAVVVSRGDVHTESGSAAVDTVQAQGWSVVARKQAFAELSYEKFAENMRPLNLQ